MLNRRGCGVLLHPTSLPGPGGIGSLGVHGRRFVDLLCDMGMSYWQVLPLTPPACGNSPYSAFSAQPVGSVVQNAGTFTLTTPGTYWVIATLNAPPQTNLNTYAVLRSNGAEIPSTQTRIVNGGNAVSYVLQALVTSNGTTTVSLTTADTVTLTAQPADAVTSISFLRIA